MNELELIIRAIIVGMGCFILATSIALTVAWLLAPFMLSSQISEQERKAGLRDE